MRTFADGSPRVGMVYCWYRMIDEQARVSAPPWAPVIEGSALDRLLELSVGTGSSPLIRRSALGDLRYSLELDACEDWLLQLQMAAKHEVACTRAFLLGYRMTPRNMSADRERMTRATIRLYEILLPDLRGRERRIAKRGLRLWRAIHAIAQSRWPLAATIAQALKRPFVARRLMAELRYRREEEARRSRSGADNCAKRPFFQSLSPDEF